jgi:hypothetical protein
LQKSWSNFCYVLFLILLFKYHIVFTVKKTQNYIYKLQIFVQKRLLIGLKVWYILLFSNKWISSYHSDEDAKAAGIVHELNTLVFIWFNRLSKLFNTNRQISEFTLVKFNVVYVFSCHVFSGSFVKATKIVPFFLFNALIILYSYFFYILKSCYCNLVFVF